MSIITAPNRSEESSRPAPVATIADASAYCRLSRSTIRRCLASGRLAAKRVGGRVLIPYTALDRLILPATE